MPRNGGKISVVMPTHNRADFLGKSIDSVLSQTYEDFEIIVIDNNSTDNTEEILKKYKDRRIKYVRNNENRGAGGARNQGIGLAEGSYITFLDSDDQLLPTKFEKQLTKLHTLPNNCGLVYCGFCYVSNQTSKPVKYVFPKFYGNVYDDVIEKNLFPIHAPIIKKECFERCGMFDTTLAACEDWDLWIRFAKYYEFAFVPEILAKYTIHGQQKSIDIKSTIMAMESIVEKYQSELHERPRALANRLKRIASLYCLNDKPVEGRKYFIASIRSNPFHYGTYVHLCLSLFSSRIHKKIINRFSFLKIGDVRLTF
jgi:glycosyltransferase involved in cell wall biosynthesis